MGDLDLSLGPILLGTCINTFLFGVVASQYARYYSTAFHDPCWLKILVFTLFVLDTFYSGSIIYMLYEYCIKSFGNLEALSQPLWPYPFTVLQWALIACITQFVLSFRIYRLNRNQVVFHCLVLASIVVLGFGVSCAIRSFILTSSSGYLHLPTLRPWVACWLILQVTLDVFITGYLVNLLKSSRTGFSSTDRLVNRFIKTAVQTGLFCSMIAAADLIVFSVCPYTNLYGLFAIPIGRVYTNALLDTLLIRERTEKKTTEQFETESKTGSICRFRTYETQTTWTEGGRVIVRRPPPLTQKQPRKDSVAGLMQPDSPTTPTPLLRDSLSRTLSLQCAGRQQLATRRFSFSECVRPHSRNNTWDQQRITKELA